MFFTTNCLYHFTDSLFSQVLHTRLSFYETLKLAQLLCNSYLEDLQCCPSLARRVASHFLPSHRKCAVVSPSNNLFVLCFNTPLLISSVDNKVWYRFLLLNIKTELSFFVCICTQYTKPSWLLTSSIKIQPLVVHFMTQTQLLNVFSCVKNERTSNSIIHIHIWTT